MMKSFFQVARKYVDDSVENTSTTEYSREVHYKGTTELPYLYDYWPMPVWTTLGYNNILLKIKDEHLKAHASSTGRDVHFTTSDGTELPFELVGYNSESGSGQWWINIGGLLALEGLEEDGLTFYLKYGDTSRIYDYSSAIWEPSSAPYTERTVVHTQYKYQNLIHNLPTSSSENITPYRNYNSVRFIGSTFSSANPDEDASIYYVYNNGEELSYVPTELPAGGITFGFSCKDWYGNTDGRQFLVEFLNVIAVAEHSDLSFYAYTGDDENGKSQLTWLCGLGLESNGEYLIHIHFRHQRIGYCTTDTNTGGEQYNVRICVTYPSGITSACRAECSFTTTPPEGKPTETCKVFLGARHTDYFTDGLTLDTYGTILEVRTERGYSLTEDGTNYTDFEDNYFQHMGSGLHAILFRQNEIRTIQDATEPVTPSNSYLLTFIRSFMYQGLGGCNG